MLPIFAIVFGAFGVFALLVLFMKRPADTGSDTDTPVVRRPCGICQESFPLSEMISRVVGEANYTRFFCDHCVTELYEESRQLHDPRFKESPPDAVTG